MYALSKQKHNSYLKGNRKKWLSSQSYILSKINILASNFITQMFNVSLLGKQSIRFKAVVQIDFSAYALSMHKQNPLRITKGNSSNRIGP